MSTALTRNLRLFPFYLAATWEGFSNAVWYLYLFAYKGLSLGEMAWLVLLGDGIIVLAEVPTGWLADRMGRRLSMMIGVILQALSAVLFIFGGNFTEFWLAMACCGLGDTFRSGAEEALLYDSCLALNKRERYRPLLASAMFFATVVMIIGQISGGALAHFSYWELPFWLEIVASSCGFAILLLMREPPRLEQSDDAGKAEASTLRSARMLIPLRLLPLALFVTVLECVPELAHFHLPAELSEGAGFTTLHLGFAYAGFELLQGLGNKLGGMQRWREPLRVLPWLGAGMLICLGLFGLRAWLGLAVYIVARGTIDLLWGWAAPLISEEANARTPSSIRATALSVINASRRLVPLAILPMSTALVARLAYPAMYMVFMLGLLIPAALGTGWLLRTRVGREQNAQQMPR